MTRTMPGRRVGSIKEMTRPGDYTGPIIEVDANDVPTGSRSVYFLLPTADPGDPWRRGGAHFDPELSAEANRARWAAGRHNGAHRVAEPPWKFRECADGSLEIRESIASGNGDPEGQYFHGFLDEGNSWRVL